MSSIADYDVLIIGGGPADLSAALAIARVNRKVAIFDSGRYRNAASKAVHNLIGHEGRTPAEWREQARADLLKYPHVTIHNVKLVKITEELAGKLFNAEDEGGNKYSGRRVLFASGVADVLPEIEGYKELWGTHIIHCAYCHGYEHSKQHIGAIVSKDPVSTSFVFHNLSKMANLTDRLTVLLDGVDPNDETALAAVGVGSDQLALIKARKFTIEHRKIVKLEKVQDNVRVCFEDGQAIEYGALISAPAASPSPDALQLISSLQLQDKVQPRGFLSNTPPFGLVRPGIYAAGDASTMIAQVIVAQSTGMFAGVGVADDIAKEETQELLSSV